LQELTDGYSFVYLEVCLTLLFPWPSSWWVKLQPSGIPIRNDFCLIDRAILATVTQLFGGIVAAAMTSALLPGTMIVTTNLGGNFLKEA
jgi:hypothetical protein